MTRPPLIAPPELRGKMHNNTVPVEIRRARRQWVADQVRAKYTRREIAVSLGIAPSSVQNIAPPVESANTFDRVSPPTNWPWGLPCRWRDFTPAQREALYLAAEKNGCETPGELMTELIRDWLEENAPDQA